MIQALCPCLSSSNIFPDLEMLQSRFNELYTPIKQRVEEKIAVLKASFEQGKNYILLHKNVDEILTTFETELRDIIPQLRQSDQSLDEEKFLALIDPCCKLLETELTPIREHLAQHKTEHKWQQSWVKLGLPEQLISTHPDCVNFLMKSGMAYMIVMFQNSTPEGKRFHGIQIDEKGTPWFRLENGVASWDFIKDNLVYDETLERVVSAHDKSITWNYISPNGFVRRDKYDYDNIYPIETLAQDDFNALKAHAREFFQDYPEIDPGVEKDCVLQIVTTHRDQIPLFWATKNMQDAYPEHITMRVIRNGGVYSFSLEMKKEERDVVFKDYPFNFLATVTSNIVTPDYEESRACLDKRVTSIPVSSERATKILEWITATNKAGIRFNFARQNCDKVAEEVLHMAGVEVDTRITARSFFYSILPNLEDIPYIGKPFATIAYAISYVTSPLWNTLDFITPRFVSQTISTIVYPATWLLQKIQTAAFSSLGWALGATVMKAPRTPITDDNRDNATQLTHFSSLIRGVSDFFDEQTTDVIYHSQRLAEWQKKQKTTVIHKYTQPQLYILPDKG